MICHIFIHNYIKDKTNGYKNKKQHNPIELSNLLI